MVQQREKLHNIKCQHASGEIFNPACIDEVDESDTCVYGRPLLETT